MFPLYPNSDLDSEDFGRVKIQKSLAYARFGASKKEAEDMKDPCGYEEVSHFLLKIQSYLLFRDIFQELLNEASSPSNPFCRVFNNQIYVDIPGFDTIIISEKLVCMFLLKQRE
jgi:hypothetical protein